MSLVDEHVSTPEERMLKVAIWHISFMRQEMKQFYKKPYNPVQGEFHNVHVDSAKCGRAEIIVEQVSHHPPVSAAHIFNVGQQVEVLGNASFGVKFGANTVTVTIDSTLEVVLGKFNETYLATQSMPNLMVTRVLWGTRQMLWVGDVIFTCPQTKMQAKIIFKTHPKKDVNIFEGVVYRQDAPHKPIFTFEGECMGAVMYERDGAKEAPLLDYSKLPALKVVYPPPEQWDPMNSLAVWAEVNKAIVADDMDRADTVKKEVEDAQRARRNSNTVPKPRFFEYNEASNRWTPKEPKIAKWGPAVSSTSFRPGNMSPLPTRNEGTTAEPLASPAPAAGVASPSPKVVREGAQPPID